MVLLLLALVGPLVVVAARSPLTELIRHDCTGQLTINPGGPFEMGFASPALDILQAHLYERIAALAAESCGSGVTTEELERRIIPSLPMAMNLISEKPLSECSRAVRTFAPY